MATVIPQNEAGFSFEELRVATAASAAFGPLVGMAKGVFTDTREDARGKVFVALRGERFDGHAYVGTALANGAKAIVVEDEDVARRAVGKVEGVTALVVPDTLVALGDLARFHRMRFSPRVVAICGAAGKTTTRAVLSRLLREILGERLLSTAGNLNNRVGVPMTMFGLRPEHEVMLLELGTNEPGEIAELGRITRPECALLTLIALEHTEGLRDLDGVEEEERAIFSALVGAERVALGNADDPRVLRCLSNCEAERKIRYGTELSDLVRLVGRRLLGAELVELSLEVAERSMKVSTSLQGLPGTLAALAGLSVVEALFPGRITEEEVARALAGPFESGRSHLVRLGNGAFVLDDSYNSNPASLRESVRTGAELAAHTSGSLFVVAGEMRELGELSRESHESAGREIAALRPRVVFGVNGDAERIVFECKNAGIESEFFASVEGVATKLLGFLEKNDVVVVKASRGVRAENVVSDLALSVGLWNASATSDTASSEPHREPSKT